MKARRERLMLASVIAFAIAGLLVVIVQSSQARRSADFTIDYAAALLIREGHPDAIYDRTRLGPLMLRLSDNAIDPRLPFDAPLAMALPYVPLTFLPLEPAFHAWQVITLGLLLLALGLLTYWVPLRRGSLRMGTLALLAFPPTWALLSEGQSSGMLLVGAALLIGAWRRNALLLGAGGGLLLAMKPHYVPVYLILLLAARAWKAIAGAVLGGVAVGLSPLLAGGIPGVVAMVWSALDAGQGLSRYNESLIGMLAPFLPGSWPTYVGFGLWGLVLVGLTGLALRRPTPAGAQRVDGVAMTVLMTGAGLLFAPHALPYDLVLLAVPAWLSFAVHRAGALPNPAFGWALVGLAVLVDLHASFIPLAPIAIGAVVGWTVWRTQPWREPSRQRPPLARAG